jgi:SAM-dependent methyltransferase
MRVTLGKQLMTFAVRRRNRRLYSALELLTFGKRAVASLPRNAGFRRRHPDFAVPPLFLLWDAQSHTDYATYQQSGEDTAKLYWNLIRSHLDLTAPLTRNVCEWGCGPGRIIRHLPDLSRGLPVRFWGTDYNRRSVAWCQRNIPSVTFKTNELAPPLEFDAGVFDVLYCRSVFTHLSEDMHFAWMRELRRVVRADGLLMISTQGLAHRTRLLPEEREQFDRGELVIRDMADEGKLNFSAFHSPAFVQNRLLAGLQVLEHRPGETSQDLWIVRNTRPS